MNAPYELPLMQSDCLQENAGPVDAATIRPDSVRVSSRPLGWKPLNVERRELEPGSDCLPGGVSEHLIFVSLGEGHVIRESGGDIAEKDLEAGLVSVHPADTPVRWEWNTRLSFTMMALDPEYFRKVARETFDMDPDSIRLKTVEGQRDPVITSIAGTLIREVMTGDAGSRLYAESLANLLSVHLLRNYTDSPHPIKTGRQVSQPRAVVLALNFIHQNYGMDVSLADIAAAAHLSTYHLTRVFKKGTGMTPHQYLVQVRVNSARSLLTAGAGDRSLAEIASAVGFADQSHLTRHFKRLLGVTPKQLRQ